MRQVAQASRVLGPSASLIVPSQATYANASAQGGGSNGALSPSATQSTPMTSTATQPIFTGLNGTFFGLPTTWFLLAILLLVAWKVFEEKRYGEETFAKIRLDVTNIFKISFAAGIGFFVFKTSQTLYPIPGLSGVAQAI
jgi:hypothetical protein